MTNKKNLEGIVPESWLCLDCGRDTAPGMLNRVEMAKTLAVAEAAGENASIYGSMPSRRFMGSATRRGRRQA
jgi:hypothetical protein